MKEEGDGTMITHVINLVNHSGSVDRMLFWKRQALVKKEDKFDIIKTDVRPKIKRDRVEKDFINPE